MNSDHDLLRLEARVALELRATGPAPLLFRLWGEEQELLVKPGTSRRVEPKVVPVLLEVTLPDGAPARGSDYEVSAGKAG